MKELQRKKNNNNNKERKREEKRSKETDLTEMKLRKNTNG